MNEKNKNMKVSVVINTFNRGKYLPDTLEGLSQQTYKNFEVIVVNGPSEDETEKVAKAFNVRYYTAPHNISKSRNVGIINASGDIIAFIDDDAVPEANWLKDLISAYEDPGVGAVGGFVYNHDGSGYQFRYGMIDKWGYPQLRDEPPYNFNVPQGHFYNINIGTNASYRRTALIEVGGFDEEIEYYHDESDVCVRIINAGYKVVQLDKAFVHHKMAPSYRRNEKKQITNWDAIVKNVIYFGLKHSKGIAPLYKRIIRPIYKESAKFKIMFNDFIKGGYNPWQYFIRSVFLVRAIVRGYRRGFFQPPKLIQNYTYKPEEFKQYIKDSGERMNFVLVTQGYPPNNTDGISRYNHTLAKELSGRGHRVYVVTKSPSNKKMIEFKDRHWVYYHNPSTYLSNETGFERTDSVLALNKSIYKTVESILEKGKIDLILAPLWDVEGTALLRKKLAPTAVTLMSPLKKVVETQWYWLNDPSLETMYELEKYCIEQADGIMAISKAIKTTIGHDYQVDWTQIKRKAPVEIVPLGVDPSLAAKYEKNIGEDKVNLLYVGRFEKRKGIDLLLNALPTLLEDNPSLTVDLVGNASIPDESGNFIFKEFKNKYKKNSWFKRIHQHGYVTDQELDDIYSNSDIFVAPSRYESFGIIFIEAMAHSKPVVGANVGGIPEIIRDGKNGLLFEVGNIADLETKLSKLIKDPTLRQKMGIASRKVLEDEFSAKRMGDNFLDFAKTVISNSRKR